MPRIKKPFAGFSLRNHRQRRLVKIRHQSAAFSAFADFAFTA